MILAADSKDPDQTTHPLYSLVFAIQACSEDTFSFGTAHLCTLVRIIISIFSSEESEI